MSDERQRAADASDAYWGLNPVAPEAMLESTGLGPHLGPDARARAALRAQARARRGDRRTPDVIVPAFLLG
jgi:hypothetical protein